MGGHADVKINFGRPYGKRRKSGDHPGEGGKFALSDSGLWKMTIRNLAAHYPSRGLPDRVPDRSE